MTSPTTLHPEDIVAATTGAIGAYDVAHARQVVAHAAAHAREPILAARLRLIHHRDPALERPYSLQVNLDVNGRRVRAHAAAAAAGQAIDAIDERLRTQLQRLARYRDHRVATGAPESAPTVGLRRTRTDSPRQVVRHKTYELPRASVDEAAWDMDLMDYAFNLFTEETTGQDMVIYRAGPTGYRLALVHPRPSWVPVSVVATTVSRRPAAHLTLPEAIEHLEATGEPFQFYVVASGRGRVVYRRHDGNYGVIVPAE